jgi:hypothetical protein
MIANRKVPGQIINDVGCGWAVRLHDLVGGSRVNSGRGVVLQKAWHVGLITRTGRGFAADLRGDVFKLLVGVSLSRLNVSALYHEAKHRKIPMTKLADELVAKGLSGSVGWQKAQELREGSPPYRTK